MCSVLSGEAFGFLEGKEYVFENGERRLLAGTQTGARKTSTTVSVTPTPAKPVMNIGNFFAAVLCELSPNKKPKS